MRGLVGAPVILPRSGNRDVRFVGRVHLAAEFQQLAVGQADDAVRAILGIGAVFHRDRCVEGGFPAFDQRRCAARRAHLAGIIARGGGLHRACQPAPGREDQVQHLRLAGVIRAEQIARPDLDPRDAAGGNARQQGLQRLALGARALAVDDDVARRLAEAAHRGIDRLDHEARHALDHLQGGGGRIFGEIRRVVTLPAAGRTGARARQGGILRRQLGPHRNPGGLRRHGGSEHTHPSQRHHAERRHHILPFHATHSTRLLM